MLIFKSSWSNIISLVAVVLSFLGLLYFSFSFSFFFIVQKQKGENLVKFDPVKIDVNCNVTILICASLLNQEKLIMASFNILKTF